MSDVDVLRLADGFSFRLKMARLPAYAQLIELGKQREGAIFLDMGCCCAYLECNTSPMPARLTSCRCCAPVGTELRKAVLDGWPVTGTIAADLSKGELVGSVASSNLSLTAIYVTSSQTSGTSATNSTAPLPTLFPSLFCRATSSTP